MPSLKVRATGVSVDPKQVPQAVRQKFAPLAHFKVGQDAPVATVVALQRYSAIIIGAPTRDSG